MLLTRSLLLVTGLLVAQVAMADCECQCVDGERRSVCTGPVNVERSCPATMCPQTLPSVAPVSTPRVPPAGTTACRQAQVLNTRTGVYEWRQLCQ